MSAPREAVLRELLAQAPAPASPGRRRQRRPRAAPPRRLSVTLPADLLTALDAVCEAQGARRAQVLEHLLRSYVEQHAPLLGPRRVR